MPKMPLVEALTCDSMFLIAEKLKFTPTPQQHQCMELNKDITIQCSATGREKPLIRWSKNGESSFMDIYPGHRSVNSTEF